MIERSILWQLIIKKIIQLITVQYSNHYNDGQNWSKVQKNISPNCSISQFLESIVRMKNNIVLKYCIPNHLHWFMYTFINFYYSTSYRSRFFLNTIFILIFSLIYGVLRNIIYILVQAIIFFIIWLTFTQLHDFTEWNIMFEIWNYKEIVTAIIFRRTSYHHFSLFTAITYAYFKKLRQICFSICARLTVLWIVYSPSLKIT